MVKDFPCIGRKAVAGVHSRTPTSGCVGYLPVREASGTYVRCRTEEARQFPYPVYPNRQAPDVQPSIHRTSGSVSICTVLLPLRIPRQSSTRSCLPWSAKTAVACRSAERDSCTETGGAACCNT